MIRALPDGRVIYTRVVGGIRETITTFRNGGKAITVEKVNG